MATAPKFTYRCTSLNENGTDLVNVTFVQESATSPAGAFGGGSFVLTLSASDAAAYFPGQVFDLTLTKKADS